ncbi:MAG: glycoside hydrolase family 2 TIM barrel-domain containing protein [Clostridia bacterium]
MQTTCFSLDRQWRFTCEPQTVLPKTINHGTIYAFAKGNGAQGPAALCFDDSAWEEVTLAHDWQHTVPFDLTGIPSHGYHPSGVCWYRRTFLLEPEDAQQEIELCFDGISGISDLYCNGTKLLHNESCYNGFSLSITDIAHFGSNPNIIAVRVDKTVWEGWWYEGCGINRHCTLQKHPRLHVAHDGLWVKPQRMSEGKWRVDCEATISNASPTPAKGELTLQIEGPSAPASKALPIALGAYEQCAFSMHFTVSSPQLWDIEEPALYKLHAAVVSAQGTDLAQTQFGFRTLRVDADSGFWLNDRPVKLLGTCNHQDHAGIGAAIPKELWRYRLNLLKQMGSNAYRCSHNPPPPELLELCDEMGILVMDENRCFSTADDALALLRSMVRRDRNHPCVVMYSLFNEEPLQGTPIGKRLALHQMAEVKKLDDTRPVLGALDGGIFEDLGANHCLDITGINYHTNNFDAFHQKYPHQPLISSELASAFATRGQCLTSPAAQVFGNYDEDCAAWGETAREANQAVLSRPYVMGMFIWTGFDYRGEPTPYEWPSVSSHFGIMDTCGFPKDVYYLYQAFWKKEPCLHLFPHWNHPAGTCVRIMAYSNLEQIELFLNGRSLGSQPNSPAVPAEWQVPFEAGTLLAKGYRNGECIISAKRETAGKPVKLLFQSAMPCLYPDTDSVAAVTLFAADSEERECPTAKSLLTVEVEGGKLLGVGNGNPNDHGPDISNTCRLYHGRCQLIVSALPNATQLTLHASARGLHAATLTLPIHERPALADLPASDVHVLDGWRMSHTLTHERPDPAQALGVGDMNSMESVSFIGTPQAAMDGCNGLYGLYQAPVELGRAGEKRRLVFARVRGFIEVYLDAQLLCSQSCPDDHRLEAVIPPDACGSQRISVIVQNNTADGRAGILDPVLLITTK